MAGRAKKYAAITVAACLAGPWAAYAQSDALVPKQALGPAELRWTGDDASGRWSLVALAKREAADPVERDEAPMLPGAALRNALAADKAAGRLAFDAQRFTGAQRWSATFFATRAALTARDDLSTRALAALDAFDYSRAQRTRYGTTLSLSEPSRLFGAWGERTFALQLAGETRDARTLSRDGASGAESVLQRTSLAETRLAFDARQSLDLPRGVRLTAAARVERYRSATAGDDANAFSGTRLVPSLALDAPLVRGIDFFARARRGDDGATLAAIDPWRMASSGFADPSLRRDFGEAGVRWRMGAFDTRVSAWRARAATDLAFTEGGAVQTLDGATRHGYALGLHYQPVPWLDLRGDVLLDLARNGSGPSLPGAPHVLGTAGANFKMSRNWDANLAVSYLGRRDGVDEATTVASSALVNGQIVHWFGRTTRLSLHVFNVLNHRIDAVDAFAASRLGWQEGAGETFLASPAEPRSFLLKFRTRF